MYVQQEKWLKLTIDGKKKIAQEIAGKNKKSDFDLQKDVYSKITKGQPVKEYIWDMKIDSQFKGDKFNEEQEKTQEQLDHMEFQNYVFETVFQEMMNPANHKQPTPPPQKKPDPRQQKKPQQKKKKVK